MKNETCYRFVGRAGAEGCAKCGEDLAAHVAKYSKSTPSGIVLVETGVQWTAEPEDTRDLVVCAYRPHPGNGDLARVFLGPTMQTLQLHDGYGHPVMTPAQARRVGWALLEAADLAEAEAKDA